MKIDHDKNGNPRAVLVCVSLPDEANERGYYDTIFIPIDEILKLRYTDRNLRGHPWLDVPAEELIRLEISRREFNRIKRLSDNGNYCAISATPKRGAGIRACRLDADRKPILRYRFSWRKPEKYLSFEDIFWLRAVAEESYHYTDVVDAIIAIGEFFQQLRKKVKPRKVSKKARRNQRERRRFYNAERANLWT